MSDKKLDFKPDDIVKSCKYLEKGVYFLPNGVTCCNNSILSSPYIVYTEEFHNGKLSYELVKERKTELFKALNGLSNSDTGGCLRCAHLIEKKFKDVSLDYIGGEIMACGMGIQHYTMCNERCTYCCYAQRKEMVPEQYNILSFFEIFKKKNKLKGNNWIDFSGGEPAILKNFDEILQYLTQNNLGTIVVYSNASIYSQKIYDLLKENKIILTTSVDTGLKSTYAKLRGLDAFDKVFENLLRYRQSGTKNLWLKYIVTETNKTEDDLWSFITTMTALKPNKIMISPEFPYGDREIPYSSVEFAAKLWCLCEKFIGVDIVDFTASVGDGKLIKYHKDLDYEIEKYRKEHPYEKNCSQNHCQCTGNVTEYDLELLAKKLPTIMKLIKD